MGSDSHDEGVAKMCDQVFHFRSRYVAVAETGVIMIVGPLYWIVTIAFLRELRKCSVICLCGVFAMCFFMSVMM